MKYGWQTHFIKWSFMCGKQERTLKRLSWVGKSLIASLITNWGLRLELKLDKYSVYIGDFQGLFSLDDAHYYDNSDDMFYPVSIHEN